GRARGADGPPAVARHRPARGLSRVGPLRARLAPLASVDGTAGRSGASTPQLRDDQAAALQLRHGVAPRHSVLVFRAGGAGLRLAGARTRDASERLLVFHPGLAFAADRSPTPR